MRKRGVGISLAQLSPAARDQVRLAIGDTHFGKLVKKERRQGREGRYKRSPKAERTLDGKVFDSKYEMQVYRILVDLLGEPRVECQIPYVLQEACRVNGVAHKPIKYVADFVIDRTHAIDAKGHQTDVFKLKRKMFEAKFGFPIHIWVSAGTESANRRYIKEKLESIKVL